MKNIFPKRGHFSNFTAAGRPRSHEAVTSHSPFHIPNHSPSPLSHFPFKFQRFPIQPYFLYPFHTQPFLPINPPTQYVNTFSNPQTRPHSSFPLFFIPCLFDINNSFPYPLGITVLIYYLFTNTTPSYPFQYSQPHPYISILYYCPHPTPAYLYYILLYNINNYIPTPCPLYPLYTL